MYESLEDQKVRCNLFNHRCVIRTGKRGLCGVRENRNGILETLVYGRLISQNVDPIEKKPLFHLLPGSRSYSIATVGCNFKCRFCQNADIAQMPSDRKGRIVGGHISPGEVVADAIQQRCATIAYTYTEPTIYFEFACDTARLAHAKGIRNVFVTNGYMTLEALEMIRPYLDAANVDLKAFNDDFYKTLCQAKLEHVLDTLRHMKRMGILVEVTTLIIPGLNDAPTELESLATFMAAELGPETPWHISRFHPTYKLIDRAPTPLQTLQAARKIGIRAGLKYVYLGNVPGKEGESTFCFECGSKLIDRMGYFIKGSDIRNGRCQYCTAPVDGIWE